MEIKTITENDFNFQEVEEPVDNVEKICENMQVCDSTCGIFQMRFIASPGIANS